MHEKCFLLIVPWGFADGISAELHSADHLCLARIIAVLVLQKDAFQNTDFSRLICRLKQKKVDTACLKRFSNFQRRKEWLNKVNLSSFDH